MGDRYSREDLERIEALGAEGLTSREIASQLGRSEAGIRNIRYRLKLKTDMRDCLQTMRMERDALDHTIADLNRTRSKLTYDIEDLHGRRAEIAELLFRDEESLKERLIIALSKLKDQKPELFYISAEEQIGKIAAQLVVSSLKWLVS